MSREKSKCNKIMKDALMNHLEASVAGSITVRNEGGYVAKFSITYAFQGKEVTKTSDNFTLGVNKTLEIPEGATNIYLKVEEYWFIGQTTTIFTKTFPTPVTKCYKIWGTTLNPKWEEISC